MPEEPLEPELPEDEPPMAPLEPEELSLELPRVEPLTPAAPLDMLLDCHSDREIRPSWSVSTWLKWAFRSLERLASLLEIMPSLFLSRRRNWLGTLAWEPEALPMSEDAPVEPEVLPEVVSRLLPVVPIEPEVLVSLEELPVVPALDPLDPEEPP